jgi:hypothetical protein
MLLLPRSRVYSSGALPKNKKNETEKIRGGLLTGHPTGFESRR